MAAHDGGAGRHASRRPALLRVAALLEDSARDPG